MILTKSQQQRFWREWSTACKVQGWTAAAGWTNAQIENERYALLARAGFDSLTEVDHLAGFDHVLSELAALTNPDNLDPQLREQNMPRTRLVYSIGRLSMSLSTSAQPMAYAAAIAADRWGTRDIESLTDTQLTQLRNTLAARTTVKRHRDQVAKENCPF